MTRSVFNPVAARADFPILDRTVNGKPLNYLDAAATSQKPRVVLDAERRYYETANAAVNRGAHTLAGEATDLFEDARARVAGYLGAGERELVWTANATEALNLVAYAIGNATLGRGGSAAERFRLAAGDEIVVTEAEHHANLIPWQELAARTGAVLRPIRVHDDGRIDLDHAAEVIGERTRLVAFAHVSNVLGIVNPVEHLTRLAHDAGALVVLDACQSAPNLPVDLRALDVDFAAVSGHKMLAPTGIGALYGKAELLDALPPFLTGGSMITRVTLESAEYLPAPQRFEPGTQRIAQAIGWAAACDWMEAHGRAEIAEWERGLGQRMLAGLAEIPGVRVLGVGDGTLERVGLAAFDVEGVHAHDSGQFLDDRGIAVRVGHHCAQPLHRRFGLTATTRASVSPFTTEEEIDQLLEAVSGIRPFFGVSA